MGRLLESEYKIGHKHLAHVTTWKTLQYARFLVIVVKTKDKHCNKIIHNVMKKPIIGAWKGLTDNWIKPNKRAFVWCDGYGIIIQKEGSSFGFTIIYDGSSSRFMPCNLGKKTYYVGAVYPPPAQFLMDKFKERYSTS